MVSCDSILNFPSNWWCRAPFHILICRPIIVFGEASLLRLRFPHFQVGLLFSFESSSYIWTSPSWNVCRGKDFPPSAAYLFIVCTMPFWRAKFKCLDVFQLTHSFFFFFVGIMPSILRVGDLALSELTEVLLWGFMALVSHSGLWFVHFEPIFGCSVRYKSKSSSSSSSFSPSFACGYPVCWKGCYFCTELPLHLWIIKLSLNKGVSPSCSSSYVAFSPCLIAPARTFE